MNSYDYESVLTFWFKELDPSDWFASDSELDKTIEKRFGDMLTAAKNGELVFWRKNMRGRLAEIIVLDQFARNIYREDGRAFEGDTVALVLAQEAALMKEKENLSVEERSFLYMPFMHSESLVIQETFSLTYFKEPGLEKRYRYAKEHHDTIKAFGRFPYRNKALGRITTAEEQTYLEKAKS